MNPDSFHSTNDDSKKTSATSLHSRRAFLRSLGYGAAAWYLLPRHLSAQSTASTGGATLSGTFGANAYYPSSRSPVAATPYVALPLGSIRARGWLLKQLELQRDGLTGHADELPEWLPALQNSAWTGGKGEAWEKGPYYLKGLVSLAYGLNDEGLKKKAQVWIDGILASQRADGFFGPEADQDYWPRMLVTYLLRDYHEATNDARVLPFLTKYYGYMAQKLPQAPVEKWAKARGADEIDTMLWLYNRTGDASLVEVAQLLRGQLFDWPKAFREGQFVGDDKMLNHNVNVCQAVKAPSSWHLLTGEPSAADAYHATVDRMVQEHGLIPGLTSGTEELAGRSPSQAVETCSIVERMLSDETNLRTFGDPQWGDSLERVAFNAMPAALSDTIQQHVYYTRPNHPSAQMGASHYSEDSLDRFVPGPRSGYPCCCYNHHMGWPKYVQNSWAATHDNGLAVLAYGPSEVTAKVGSGPTVTIVQETDYPFNETIRFKLATSAPVQFPLELRIPHWCASPQITVAGQPAAGVQPGTFFRIDRKWMDGDEVVAHFPMTIAAPVGYLQTVTLERGPLVYALRIDAEKTVVKPDPNGFDQFTLSPKTPWNYALEIDPQNPAASVQFQQTAMPENPFVAGTTPVQLTAQARRLPAWTFGRNGWEAAEPPFGPVATTEPVESIRLIPFGAQFLRITQFPHVGTPPVPPTSFADDFKDGVLADRWGIYGAGWYQENGSLNCRTKKPGKVLALGTDFADFTFEVQVAAPGQKGQAGLLFRASKPGFGDEEFDGYYAGLSTQDQALILGKSNGTWVALKRTPMVIKEGKVYPLRIVATGPKISVYGEDSGAPLLEAEDSDHASGAIGFRQVAHSTLVRFIGASVKAA